MAENLLDMAQAACSVHVTEDMFGVRIARWNSVTFLDYMPSENGIPL